MVSWGALLTLAVKPFNAVHLRAIVLMCGMSNYHPLDGWFFFVFFF